MFQLEHSDEMFQLEHSAQCSGWNTGDDFVVAAQLECGWFRDMFHFSYSDNVAFPLTPQYVAWPTGVYSTCLSLWFLVAYQEKARVGAGDGDGVVPGEVGEGGSGRIQLGGGDQEGQASLGSEEGFGCWEHLGQALDGAEGYYVEGGGDGLGTDVSYIDLCQCKGAG